MSKPITILGLETSCDETSASIVQIHNGHFDILSNVTASQVPIHRKYGGVIPEVAARNHVVAVIPTIEEALRRAGITPTSILPLRGRGRKPATSYTNHASRRVPPEAGFLPSSAKGGDKEGGLKIDAIAVTAGPGLIVALRVGVETAKILSCLWQKPLLRVNHLVGHIYANWLTSNQQQATSKQLSSWSPAKPDDRIHVDSTSVAAGDLQNDKKIFPLLALVVSGGHTELVLMKRHLHFQKIGATLDDAAGEAFDKIGSLLGIPYPAGPVMDKLSAHGNPQAFNLPRPMINTPDFNFSFAGLKTAALYALRGVPKQSPQSSSSGLTRGSTITKELDPASPHLVRGRLWCGMTKIKCGNDAFRANFAASVQKAIVDVLITKTIRAAKQYKVKTVLLAGGVAANSELRERLGYEIKRSLPTTYYQLPAKELTADNGAMIAAAGYFMYCAKKFTPWQKIKADPNWEL